MSSSIKRLLIIIAAILLALSFALGWLTGTESGLRWAYKQVESDQQTGLTIGELEGKLSGPITARDIRFKQRGYLIEIRELILDWQPGALLTGSIDINRLHATTVSVSLPPSQQTKHANAITLPDIHLPWQIKANDTVVNNLTILENEQTTAIKQIRLDADALFNQIDIKQFLLDSDDLSLRITGSLTPVHAYRHNLEINWRYRLPSSVELIGAAAIHGDSNSSEIRQRIDGPLHLSLNGQLRELQSNFHWNATVKGRADNIALLQNGLPEADANIQFSAKGNLEAISLNGTLNGNNQSTGPVKAEFSLKRFKSGEIKIRELRLLADKSDTLIEVRGQLWPNEAGGTADLALDWKNLRWPIEGDAWFNSAFGSGWLKGSPEQYSFGLTADRPWQEAPPSRWYASADGNREELNLHSLRIVGLEGETVARGRLSWKTALSWDARIDLQEINPAELYPEWHGKLNGTIFSRGVYKDKHLTVNTDISQIKGKLRDYPFSLQSRLSWHNKGLDIDSFELFSGDSTVSLRGRAAHHLQLHYAIDSKNLDELYPNATGELSATGFLSGEKSSPIIQTTLNGKSVHLPGYGIAEEIHGTVNADILRWQNIDIELAAKGLHFDRYAIESLELTATDNHISTKAKIEGIDLNLELNVDAVGLVWQGQIQQAAMSSEQIGHWKLAKPTSFTVSAVDFSVESLCLQKLSAQICSKANRHNDQWQAQLMVKELPLRLFNPWLPPDLTLDGVSNGEIYLNYSNLKQLIGSINITLPAGAVSYPLLEGERNRWEYRGGTVVVELNSNEIKAVTAITADNNDYIKLRATLPQANLLEIDLTKQRLDAEVLININDLSLVEALLDEVQDLQGELNIKLNATGTLAEPKLSGFANLKKGSLRIPRLGITLHKLTADAQSQNLKQINFRLDTFSGEGNLTLKGSTTLSQEAGWPTTINLTGESFEVSRIPEVRLEISPDLNIEVNKRTIRTKGKIHIPYAKLQPKDITTAARVSEDAFIVGGEHTPVEKWKMFTRIKLTLGEQINFYGFGFEGRFGGSLLLEDIPGQLTKATGELNVQEGRYRAYAQRLDVEYGRLLYTGSAVSNPGLDFRSIRKISNITAGLNVRGTLNQPRMELFSIPAMGQTDALSYLLLGRPIENASGEEGAMMAKATLALGLAGGDRLARTLGDRFGLDEMRVETSDTDDQASLVIGRYLSPKLYISYGVGLIEAVSTFNVRYQLSDKWQLKGESGEHQGADLFYSIER